MERNLTFEQVAAIRRETQGLVQKNSHLQERVRVLREGYEQEKRRAEAMVEEVRVQKVVREKDMQYVMKQEAKLGEEKKAVQELTRAMVKLRKMVQDKEEEVKGKMEELVHYKEVLEKMYENEELRDTIRRALQEMNIVDS